MEWIISKLNMLCEGIFGEDNMYSIKVIHEDDNQIQILLLIENGLLSKLNKRNKEDYWDRDTFEELLNNYLEELLHSKNESKKASLKLEVIDFD